MMSLTFKKVDPEEWMKERELEIKKRREQYPIPLSTRTRKEILRRCEILKIMGDDGIGSYYYQSNDQELVDRYSWVLDPDHDDLLAKPFTITL
jgi:hypothetical protein|tara:strand:+ start:202 stop:480 length:279 start_codon:yes stop_codon:yes gene_type:complete